MKYCGNDWSMTQRHKASKGCWKNWANRLAQRRVAPDLQLVSNEICLDSGIQDSESRALNQAWALLSPGHEQLCRLHPRTPEVKGKEVLLPFLMFASPGLIPSGGFSLSPTHGPKRGTESRWNWATHCSPQPTEQREGSWKHHDHQMDGQMDVAKAPIPLAPGLS